MLVEPGCPVFPDLSLSFRFIAWVQSLLRALAFIFLPVLSPAVLGRVIFVPLHYFPFI